MTIELGGAYDTVPEVNLLLSLFAFSDNFFPVLFDEAGEYITLRCSESILEY